MGVTIKDVAKEAGVSISTTSYALNNSGPVSAEKVKLVFEAAERLGYVPSGIARSLKLQKMGFVGYFTYTLAGPVFSELTKGIEDVFNRYGQEMIASCCAPEMQKVTRLFAEKMVDGAIIFTQYIDEDLLVKIAGPECPIVVLDRELCGEHISNFLIDNGRSAYDVGKYIHSLGHHKVGCILGSGFDGEERKKGFFKAAREFKFEMRDEWILHGEFQEKIAYETVKNLAVKKNLPDILFGFSDEMAIGAIQALHSEGYNVPKDISIIGMDDIPLASYITPKLTSIHRPIYELGELAAETLYQMVHKKQHGIRKVLPTYLIERESCIPKRK